MATQAYPTLNGIAPSWADVSTSYSIYEGSLVEMADFSDLSWGSTVEIGNQKGAEGGRTMRRTTGSITDECSATFYMTGFRQLLRALMEKAPTRGAQKLISLVGFDINVNWTPPGEPDIYTTIIKGCRVSGRSVALAEGSDATKVEIPLNPIQVVDVIDGAEVVLL